MIFTASAQHAAVNFGQVGKGRASRKWEVTKITLIFIPTDLWEGLLFFLVFQPSGGGGTGVGGGGGVKEARQTSGSFGT